MKPPIEGMKTVPYFCEHPYQFSMWYNFIVFMSEYPEAKEAFKKDTEYDLDDILKSRGINSMIDKQTGYQQSVLAAWCDWVTENHWGGNLYQADAQ